MTERLRTAFPSPPDDRDYQFSAIAPTIAPPMPGYLPGSIPPPLDQGNTGTCVANAVTGAANYLFHRSTGKWLFDENSAQTLYVAATGDTSLQQGTYPRLVLEYARTTGILGRDGQYYRIGAYHSLLSGNRQANFEQAIGVLHLPVVIALPWPDDWMIENVPFDTLPTPPAGEPDAGGHCLWGFRYVMKHPAANDLSLRLDDDLENSWSASFALNGRVYGSAAYLMAKAFDLWSVSL